MSGQFWGWEWAGVAGRGGYLVLVGLCYSHRCRSVAMPTAPVPLFQAVFHRIWCATRGQRVPLPSRRRLALLVTGIIATKSCVLAQVAAELLLLGVSQATSETGIERRLRRTLADPHLAPATCYAPAVRAVLAVPPGPAPGGASRWVVLAADDSSKRDQIHLFRLSLAYWGGGLPLAWATWRQNEPLPEGRYWAEVDAVLDQVATLLPPLPPGVAIVLTGDRAFDVPAFVDRAEARGWHWAVRGKANGSLRFRDRRGREHAVQALVRWHVGAPGQRYKARGHIFKNAGWRVASLVACWAPGEQEPLVVLTDLPCRWDVLRLYGRRFWIEPTFRNDKTKGWRWEDCQVRGVDHHQRLLLAMAWATLVVLCLGVEAAAARRAAQAQRIARRATRQAAGTYPVDPARPWRARLPAVPQHAQQSLFTLGLRAARGWIHGRGTPTTGPPKGPVPWRLPALDAPSWNDQWLDFQAAPFNFAKTVRS